MKPCCDVSRDAKRIFEGGDILFDHRGVQALIGIRRDNLSVSEM